MRTVMLGAQGQEYRPATYRVSDDQAWHHALYGHVPGYQIDYIYRPSTPPDEPGRLRPEHIRHLTSLVRYLEASSGTESAFTLGNLSTMDHQHRAGHGGLALICSLRVAGASDQAGRHRPVFTHSALAIDQPVEWPRLAELILRFVTRVQMLAPPWYIEYSAAGLQHAAESIPRYLQAFGPLPEAGHSRPRTFSRPEELPFQHLYVTCPSLTMTPDLATAAARLGALLYHSDIRWTAISTGYQAQYDASPELWVRFVPTEHRPPDDPPGERTLSLPRLLQMDEAELIALFCLRAEGEIESSPELLWEPAPIDELPMPPLLAPTTSPDATTLQPPPQGVSPAEQEERAETGAPLASDVCEEPTQVAGEQTAFLALRDQSTPVRAALLTQQLAAVPIAQREVEEATRLLGEEHPPRCPAQAQTVLQHQEQAATALVSFRQEQAVALASRTPTRPIEAPVDGDATRPLTAAERARLDPIGVPPALARASWHVALIGLLLLGVGVMGYLLMRKNLPSANITPTRPRMAEVKIPTLDRAEIPVIPAVPAPRPAPQPPGPPAPKAQVAAGPSKPTRHKAQDAGSSATIEKWVEVEERVNDAMKTAQLAEKEGDQLRVKAQGLLAQMEYEARQSMEMDDAKLAFNELVGYLDTLKNAAIDIENYQAKARSTKSLPQAQRSATDAQFGKSRVERALADAQGRLAVIQTKHKTLEQRLSRRAVHLDGLPPAAD